MLKFDGAWRFTPPPDGRYKNQAIPAEALEDFFQMIMRVATQGDRWEMLEHFKRAFCSVVGITQDWSSTESWAETDLRARMEEASATNAPLFLEAFFDACESLRQGERGFYAPDSKAINKLCERHGIGYEISPPELLLRGAETPAVAVPERPPTLAEQAIELYQKSLSRSEELLAEGRGREAVQEILWLLESVATAFKGLEVSGEVVQGQYFVEIVKEIRKSSKGTTTERALEWMTSLYGYLSSPTGGGVRHGLDLNKGIPIDQNEARLFCNLVRSYLWYLLAENKRLRDQRAKRGARE